MKTFLLVALAILASMPGIHGQSHSGPAASASDVYQFGDRRVRIPAPEGFVGVSQTFEKIIERMRASEDPNNDCLETYVPLTFVPELRRSQDIDLGFYAKLSVSKSTRNVDLTPEQFDATVEALEKNFDTFIEPNGAMMKQVEANAEKNLSELMGSKAGVNFTGNRSLGFFEKSDKVFSGMMLAELDIYGRHVSTLATVSILNVGRRLVFAYTYKMFPSGKDVAVLQDFAKKWNAAIIAANK